MSLRAGLAEGAGFAVLAVAVHLGAAAAVAPRLADAPEGAGVGGADVLTLAPADAALRAAVADWERAPEVAAAPVATAPPAPDDALPPVDAAPSPPPAAIRPTLGPATAAGAAPPVPARAPAAEAMAAAPTAMATPPPDTPAAMPGARAPAPVPPAPTAPPRPATDAAPEVPAKAPPPPAVAAAPGPDAPRPRPRPTPSAPAPALQAAGAGGGAVAGSQPQAQAAAGAAEAGRDLLAGWGGRIRAAVERHKRAPVSAEGVAQVVLSVAGDGGLVALSLASGTGNAALDRAALDAVRAAAPFPAAPEGLGPGPHPFAFSMRFAR